MQGWSLERKIRVTQTRIMEWYMRYDGQVFISFSGGKDSTVLLDLARRVYLSGKMTKEKRCLKLTTAPVNGGRRSICKWSR